MKDQKTGLFWVCHTTIMVRTLQGIVLVIAHGLPGFSLWIRHWLRPAGGEGLGMQYLGSGVGVSTLCLASRLVVEFKPSTQDPAHTPTKSRCTLFSSVGTCRHPPHDAGRCTADRGPYH